ncbi:MAG: hypothetical protein GY719_36345 [bacterium]|nr:hypothetical protein [bacterium]
MVAPSAADLRLERSGLLQWLDSDGKVSSSEERGEVVFVGESAARVDAGTGSAIARTDDGVFLWLDHEAKEYAELPLPLKLEDLLTDEERTCLKQIPWVLENAEATVRLTDESRVIDGRKTVRLRVEGHLRDLQFERDTWITRDLSVDLGPYFQLIQNFGALSTLSRGWIGDVIAAQGYPVESTATRRARGRSRVAKLRLVAVSEVSPDTSRYLPPVGYSPSLKRPPVDLKCITAPRPQQ